VDRHSRGRQPTATVLAREDDRPCGERRLERVAAAEQSPYGRRNAADHAADRACDEAVAARMLAAGEQGHAAKNRAAA
jgi:hypothetical protein